MNGNTLAALVPAAVVGVFFFGTPALSVLISAVAGCAVCDAVCRLAARRLAGTDSGRTVTMGLLLGLSLPPTAPVWMVAVGCAAAIFSDRLIRGGIGFNPFHPALVAYVCLLLSFPVQMTAWSTPVGIFASPPDAISSATPLTSFRVVAAVNGKIPEKKDLDLAGAFVGRKPGSIGETSALALVLGGAFLLWRRVIGWEIPAAFVGGAALPAALFSLLAPGRFAGAGFHLLTGGLLLGAIFIASDLSVAPIRQRGRLLFGAGCGVLTWTIRTFGIFPEGAAFAILLMGALKPLIDSSTAIRDPVAGARGLSAGKSPQPKDPPSTG